MGPARYSRAAEDSPENLRFFEIKKKLYDETLKSIERGRSSCTKMLEERDQDLEHLSERGSRVPSGLPLELQDWLRDYIAAKSLRRSLDRMSLLLHKQEKEASQKASLPPGHHPIQASAGSVRTEGELQTPVVKQSPNFKEATSTVALIPQAKSITETLGAEHLRQRRVKARGRRQDKHAGMSPTSVLDVGDELVT